MTPIQREHLALIRSTTGALRPEDVLEDARNPNSPLHPCFTWDDSAAAEAYRMIQARAVIRVAVRFLPVPEVHPQRVRVTVAQQAPLGILPDAAIAINTLFRMNLREAEIAVQIHVLSLEKDYLTRALREASEGSGYATEQYAIDLFVRGVPMLDLVETVNHSADETVTEADVLGWVQRYGGHRPRNWSAKLAKEQWDADEGSNFAGVFGVPPYKPPARISVNWTPSSPAKEKADAYA